MVLMREKKGKQSHEIEMQEDKVGRLKKNKKMKQKIGPLQHQQDIQTNLMIQQMKIQKEMQSDIQQFFQLRR